MGIEKKIFCQNLRNNILGKVKKFGTLGISRLGVVANNVVPRVKMTPPPGYIDIIVDNH